MTRGRDEGFGEVMGRLWGAEDDQCQPDGEAIQRNKANFQKSASALAHNSISLFNFVFCTAHLSARKHQKQKR